jgi:hypothetical protein
VSVAAIMVCMYHLLDVHVVAFVPAEGPVPPPTTVVMPEARACGVRVRIRCHVATGRGAGAEVWTHLLPQLSADVVHVDIERTSRQDEFLPGDHLRRV